MSLTLGVDSTVMSRSWLASSGVASASERRSLTVSHTRCVQEMFTVISTLAGRMLMETSEVGTPAVCAKMEAMALRFSAS